MKVCGLNACIKTIISQPDQKSSNPQPVVNCDNGYVLSLSKKKCIQMPQNAHPVDNGKDIWLCNDGYIESSNNCVASLIDVSKDKDNQSKVVESVQNDDKTNFIIRFFRKLFK